IYLKDAAARWYTDWSILNGPANALVWHGAPGSFTNEFMQKFQSETRLATYQEKFDELTQGRKKIEEYNDEFTRLLQKVDPAAAIPNQVLKRKYIKGLNHKIGPMVYAANPGTLNQAMNSAIRVATGFEMAEGSRREANFL